MKKEKEIDFVNLLQDEEFIRLVKDTLDSADQYYILNEKYPADKELLVNAVEFIKVNMLEQKRMPENDVIEILQNIKAYSEAKKKRDFRKSVVLVFSKIAAVLLVFICCSFLFYKYLRKDPLKDFAEQKTKVQDEAVLILSDGSTHKINEYNSNIEYSKNGGEIVVRNKRSKDEKFVNVKDSKEPVINQIIVPYGHRHNITLSDGTQVVLNSGSKLVFPAEFSGKTRGVYLIGEGYFDVSRDENKPFIVKTDEINIKVLGTRFNVSAYADENVTSAVLVEGSVSVYHANKIIENTPLTKLVPGQGCFYTSTTSESVVRSVDVADYISWKDGLFRFKDQPLVNVIQRVCKYYNRNISIEGDKLPSTLISGKLVLTDNITSTMNYLSKTLEARYEVTSDGNYIIKEQ